MMWLIGLLAPTVGEKAAKPVAWAIIALALLAALGTAKCAYDRSVVRKATQEQAIKQAKRERKADANLEGQKAKDDTAAQNRREEIDNATKGIPDQAPSARQRARVCVELVRRGNPPPECKPAR